MPKKMPTQMTTPYLLPLAVALISLTVGIGDSLATPPVLPPGSFYKRESLMSNMLLAAPRDEKATEPAKDSPQPPSETTAKPLASFIKKAASTNDATNRPSSQLEIPPTRPAALKKAQTFVHEPTTVRLPAEDRDLTAIATLSDTKSSDKPLRLPRAAERIEVRSVSASTRKNATVPSLMIPNFPAPKPPIAPTGEPKPVLKKLATTPPSQQKTSAEVTAPKQVETPTSTVSLPAVKAVARVAQVPEDVAPKLDFSKPAPLPSSARTPKANAVGGFPQPLPRTQSIMALPSEPQSITAPVTPPVSIIKPDPVGVNESVVSPKTLNISSTPFESVEPAPLMQTDPVSIAAPWPGDERGNSVYQPNHLFQHDRPPAVSCDRWPCNTCGQTFCCCPYACWGVRADAMFLHRSRANGFDDPLVNCNCATPTLLSPDSVSMGTEATPRYTVFRDNQCGGVDLEGTYYNVDHWTGSQRLEGPVVALGEDLGTGFADIRYESQLQNAELNLFKDWTNWTQFMLGFRWLELEERGSVIGSGDLIPVFDRRVEVRNTLLGGQVGLRKSIWDRGGFVTANATVKGGVFHNQMQRSTTGFGTSPLEKSGTAFVGELDFDMNFEITSCWSLNAGYQVLWLADVAEALDQFFSPDQIFDDGSPILHGARIGLTRKF